LLLLNHFTVPFGMVTSSFLKNSQSFKLEDARLILRDFP
jgi:hypothetical protein